MTMIIITMLQAHFAVVYMLKANVGSGESNAQSAKVKRLSLRWEFRES
jgi:hypothetical protein